MDISISAYRKRIEANHKTLMRVAQQLESKGYTVYIVGRRTFQSFILVEQGNYFTFVGYKELPYRWYIGENEFRGKRRLNHDPEEFPFTLDEITSSMIQRTTKRYSMYKKLPTWHE